MLRRTYDDQICSVARTLEVVGERWTLLIVRDALTGASRFDHFRHRLGLAASVLSERLGRLVSAGVLDREPYHTHPTRYEYRLTPRGHELAVVVVALMQWGDRYLAGDAGPPGTVDHRGCGGAVAARLVCADCLAEVDNGGVGIRYVRRRRESPVPVPRI